MLDNKPTHVDLFSGILSAVFPSPPIGPASGPSRSARTTRGARASSRGTGPRSPSTETSGLFPELPTGEQPSSPGVSRARLSPSAGSDEARMMTVISGHRCLRQSKLSGHLGSLLKMCLMSSKWFSRLSFLIWKPLAIPVSCSCYQLSELVHHTGDAEFGLFPNHSIPTPTASDYIERKCTNTARATALNFKTNKAVSLDRWFQNRFGRKLTPEFSEWMMGFPIGWTQTSENNESRHSATP